jgi:hypothetical protein
MFAFLVRIFEFFPVDFSTHKSGMAKIVFLGGKKGLKWLFFKQFYPQSCIKKHPVFPWLLAMGKRRCFILLLPYMPKT